jgi:hypothetical protein
MTVASPASATRPRRRLRRPISAASACALSLFFLASCSSAAPSVDDVATLNSGTTPGTAVAADDAATTEAKFRDYAKCMRDNGVANYPDPKVGTDGRIDPGGFRDANIDRTSQTFQDANKACASKRPQGGFGGGQQQTAEQRAKFQDASLKYAQCLRDQGLTVKDPDFSQGPGAGGPGGPGGAGGAGGGGQTGAPPADGQAGGPPQGGQGGAGGRGTGFIARALGLDENDPAVVAAQEKCQPVLQQALTDAGIGQPGGAGGAAPAAPAGQ